MKYLIILIAVLTFVNYSVPAYAAFPMRDQAEPGISARALAHERASAVHSAGFRHAMKKAPAPAPQDMSGNQAGLVIGILALLFGILSLATWATVAALIFAAAAIILGVLGISRPWSGLSLAGLILGIVGGVVALVSLVS